MKPPARIPRATYRLQMHAGFTFDQLAAIVPYLSQLGISDLYLSPIFLATPGSTHGYDVCDHNQINPELGGMDGLRKVSALLKQRDMGLLLDFVPNHMGVQVPENWRWMDVLENGHLSRYAPFFDIEWNPRQISLQDRILVPLLGDFYGRILDQGEIKLKYEEAAFHVYYGTLRFPLRPESYGTILKRLAWFKNPGDAISQELEKLAQQFINLPKATEQESLEAAQERQRRRHALRQELAVMLNVEKLHGDLGQVLEALNGKPGNPDSFDNLHQILEEQSYRLAYWKTGTHEINYRRFFAVDTLVGLHMESPAVFEECHRLLASLIEECVVTGVRIDHIDGLMDPVEYLRKLSQLAGRGDTPVYSLVEKILTEGEQMVREWDTHGTTGYDFASTLVNLLIATPSEAEFTRIYHEFAGISRSPVEQGYQLKLTIMEELFPNAVDNLALDLEAHVKSDRRWRDWTVSDLRPAIARIIACLAVYRTYIVPGQPPSATDIQVIDRAVSEAMRLNVSDDPLPYNFIRDLWTGRYPDEKAGPELKTWAQGWLAQLQQYTGAIMAKSVEDTLFYRYVRLFAANEVGHHPGEFGRPVAAFHKANLERQQQWPAAMLGTSTHDTKMSEDVRSRLFALSELPDWWDAALHRWSQLNYGAKTMVNDRLAPDANEEYLLYQILLGSWPLESGTVDATYVARIQAYIVKALSEAKAHTNWSNPDNAWLDACKKFVATILDPKLSSGFLADFAPFAEDLSLRGWSFSLVQTILKLTSPGVPDIYQGTEMWDFSLVDPDNRRPVDYAAREQAQDGVEQASMADLIATWKDGRVKLKVIQTLLRFRGAHPLLFSQGSYVPLAVAGPDAPRLVASLRRNGSEQLLVVAACALGADPKLGLEFAGTKLTLPVTEGSWRELLTGRVIPGSAELDIRALLGGLPAAVFALV